MRKLETLINYLDDCKEAAELKKEVEQYEMRIAALDAAIDAFTGEEEIANRLCEIWEEVNHSYAVTKLNLAKVNLRIAKFEMKQAFAD